MENFKYIWFIELFMPGGGLTLLFASGPYPGIAFYVLPERVAQSREALSAARLRRGLVPEPLQ